MTDAEQARAAIKLLVLAALEGASEGQLRAIGEYLDQISRVWPDEISHYIAGWRDVARSRKPAKHERAVN